MAGRIPRALLAVILAFAVGLLACGDDDAPQLLGTSWSNDHGTVTFREDAIFVIDTRLDPVPDSGTIFVDGDSISLTTHNRLIHPCSSTSGEYEVVFAGGNLEFHVVEDECSHRSDFLDGATFSRG